MQGLRHSVSFLLLAAVFALAMTACRKDPVPEPEIKAVLRDISVKEHQVIIPSGGTAELPFVIRDAAAEVNTDVSSPACQIGLWSAEGKISFRLASIRTGAAKGEYYAVLQADPGADFSEEIKLELKVSESSTIRSDAVVVMSEGWSDYPVRTGLPIVQVFTKGSAPVVSKENWVEAVVSIRGAGQYPNLPERKGYIRGRGNTTWTWAKKPYALKFEEKAEVMGMPAHKRWVLLANFMDRTLMRDALAFHLSHLTSLAWTPRYRYCELMLNGKHMGNYLLTEQIRVDNDRVDIEEKNPGSFLFESDFHFDNKWQWLENFGSSWWYSGKIPFGVKFPDEDDMTSASFRTAKDYIHKNLSVLYGSDFKDPEKGYRAYLDVDSFIDYWIVFEVMGNHELNNPGSVYTHVDSGGKWTAGPVWDFDWGGLSYRTSPQAKTGLVCRDAVWYSRLFEDPWFRDRLKTRWNELLPVFKDEVKYIDELKSLLVKSAAINFGMWNPAEDASQNGGHIINGDENMAFDAAVQRLRSIYLERLDVISSVLSAM